MQSNQVIAITNIKRQELEETVVENSEEIEKQKVNLANPKRKKETIQSFIDELENERASIQGDIGKVTYILYKVKQDVFKCLEQAVLDIEKVGTEVVKKSSNKPKQDTKKKMDREETKETPISKLEQEYKTLLNGM